DDFCERVAFPETTRVTIPLCGDRFNRRPRLDKKILPVNCKNSGLVCLSHPLTRMVLTHVPTFIGRRLPASERTSRPGFHDPASQVQPEFSGRFVDGLGSYRKT